MNFTTIHHKVRKMFNLSCNEYCIADMIYHLSANPKAPIKGWCNQSRENMAAQVDLSRRAVIKIVNSLVDKGLVERNSVDFVRTTEKWYDAIMGVKNEQEATRVLSAKRGCEESAQGVKKVHRGCEESAQGGCEESAHYNNTLDNNIKNNILIPFQKFIEVFNSLTKKQFNGCTKSKSQYAARCKEGRSLDDFKLAIQNCMAETYHKETKLKYLTPEFITRSDKLEKYLNSAPPPVNKPIISISDRIKQQSQREYI